MASVKFREGDVVKHKSTMFDGEWRVDYLCLGRDSSGGQDLRVSSAKHPKAKHIFAAQNCILLRRPLRVGDRLVNGNGDTTIYDNEPIATTGQTFAEAGWRHEGGIPIDRNPPPPETDEEFKKRMRDHLEGTQQPPGVETELQYSDATIKKPYTKPVLRKEMPARSDNEELQRLRDALVPLKDELERTKREKIDLEAMLYRKDQEIAKLKRGKR